MSTKYEAPHYAGSKIGNLSSLEYTPNVKVFFTPHSIYTFFKRPGHEIGQRTACSQDTWIFIPRLPFMAVLRNRRNYLLS
jgi:hypothetical protein